jgi:hypothetical protein
MLDADESIKALPAILGEDWFFREDGGNFMISRSYEFQGLHNDIGPNRIPEQMRRSNPVPRLAVNFIMQGITWEGLIFLWGSCRVRGVGGGWAP